METVKEDSRDKTSSEVNWMVKKGLGRRMMSLVFSI